MNHHPIHIFKNQIYPVWDHKYYKPNFNINRNYQPKQLHQVIDKVKQQMLIE